MVLGLNLNIPPPTEALDDESASRALTRFLNKIEIEPEDWIGFDTETHAMKISGAKSGSGSAPLDWMHDTITFWSLCTKFDGKYERYCFDQTHFQYFIPLLENPKARIAGYNLKYDAHVSWNSGVNIWNSYAVDFMVAATMLNENMQGRVGLKHVTQEGFTSEWLKALRMKIQKEMGYSVYEQLPKAKLEEIEQEVRRRVKPWEGFNMTPFKELFTGCVDPKTGKPAKEYETSLYDLPRDKVVNYASLDAYGHLKIAEHIIEVMKDHDSSDYSAYKNMWEYFQDIEVPITEILWKMERRGLPLDKEKLQEMIAPMEEEKKKISSEINRISGEFINLNSPSQVARLLYGDFPEDAYERKEWRNIIVKWTKGGAKGKQPSTGDEALSILAANGEDEEREKAKLIQRYRKVDKILGTYVKKLHFCADFFEDGRVHTGFKQYGARTGRFSTAEPLNSQNLPNPETDEFGIRTVFTAESSKELDGTAKEIGPCPVSMNRKSKTKYRRKLIVADYGQLEMRIMAHFSEDEGMLEAIRSGLDMHCVTVEKMWGVPYEDVKAAKNAKDEGTATDEQKEIALLRKKAKTVGFGIIYGAGATTIGLQLEVPKEEAQDLIDKYFQAFPGVKSFMTKTIWSCKEIGFVTTILGRRRNLPDIRSHDFMTRSHAEREANNSVIQGTAADLVKAAMIAIDKDKRLNEMGVELINQIHDELVLLGPECEEDEEEALSLVKDYMEYPFNENQDPLLVPTPVDARLVDNWAEAK